MFFTMTSLSVPLGIIVLGKKYPFLSHTFCSGVAHKGSHFPCVGFNFFPRGTTAQKKTPSGHWVQRGLEGEGLEGLSGPVSENLGDTTRNPAEGLFGKPTYLSSSPP